MVADFSNVSLAAILYGPQDDSCHSAVYGHALVAEFALFHVLLGACERVLLVVGCERDHGEESGRDCCLGRHLVEGESVDAWRLRAGMTRRLPSKLFLAVRRRPYDCRICIVHISEYSCT